MGALAERIRSLELAVEGLARVMFVSGAGDDAQATDTMVNPRQRYIPKVRKKVVFVSGAGDDADPTSLVVGATIHGGTHKVAGTHRDSDGSLLRAHLKHLYTGKSTIVDPSEDADSFVTADTDTANQVGQRLLSGEKPQMAPTIKEKDSLRQPEDRK